MRFHTIRIWRNPETKQWHHQFFHSNGRELTRQSEGVNKKSVAIKSAQTAYYLGELMHNAGTEWFGTTRDDVRVVIEVTR